MAARPEIGDFGWGALLNTYLDEQALAQTNHIAATAAHGATGAVVGTTNTQTLTNKTLTSPTINGIGQKIWARKTADTSRNSTTTLADDPHLVIAVPAAGTYAVKGSLRVGAASAGANGKIKVGFTFPTGSLAVNGQGPVSSLTTGTSGSVESSSQYSASSPTTAVAYGVSETASASVTIDIDGELIVSASGNLALQWAQNASNAIATILQIGSFLMIERTA